LPRWVYFEVFDRVGHVDFVARDAAERERFVEELARGADERFACEIFAIAGNFTDEHHARCCRAFAEHGLRGVLVQRAASARWDRSAQ
jgi:hypothetical protein